MATQVQVVFDCADPARLARFWAAALQYTLEEEWNSAAAIVDPDGVGPRLYFQQVPEPKTVKNRVHLDLNQGGLGVSPADRRQRVDAEVKRLKDLDADELYRMENDGEYWVTMADPEGNEFCVQ
ncbi:MAG: VOC family protein [Chloroflexota bacterium]|nr:VOC family protein [Chloroflexota bacterium]